MKKEKSLKELHKHKSYSANKIFSFIIILVLLFDSTSGIANGSTKSRSRSKGRKRSVAVKKHKPTAEELTAAREKAACEAAEAKIMENRNSVMARAYRLYDSGTSENLQGNYKYSVLQLKLANELLQENGESNTSLAHSTLSELASAARSAKDYSLAKSTYTKLLGVNPQDTNIFLNLAQIEIAQSNFQSALNYINKVLEINPNNAEAKLLSDFVVNKLKPVKR